MNEAMPERDDTEAARETRDLVRTAVRRRRRSARREAQIRRRRFVALVVTVVSLASLVLLAMGALRAGAAPAPGAGATLASVAGDGFGVVLDTPSVAHDDATASRSLKTADLKFANGVATVSSSVVGSALVSESDVSLSDVSLLGGVVKADSIELVATADAGPSSADAGVGGSYVNGLEIDGRPVTDPSGPVQIPGVGTLTVLDATVDQGSPSPSAVVTGLVLVLDQQVGDLATGSVIVVGRAAASSDAATAQQLARLAAQPPGPTPLPAPLPTPTVTARPARTSPGKTGDSSSDKGGKSSSSQSGNSSTGTSGSGAAGGSVADSTMPAPAPPTKEILARFPGAVFPVRGPVDYTDTFGAYRADMKGHRHEGNDIFARMGTPIVAVLAGTIRYSTYGIGGNNAHLTDARGDYFYYAHMVRFAAGLKSGDHVARGQVIGYVGETGDAAGTSPHCHFEIHPGGGPAIDPFPYLEAWRAAAAGVPAAAATPVATISEAGVGIPLPVLLARRGVIVGMELGGAAAVAEARPRARRAHRPAVAQRARAGPVRLFAGRGRGHPAPARAGASRAAGGARNGRAPHGGHRRTHAHEVLTWRRYTSPAM